MDDNTTYSMEKTAGLPIDRDSMRYNGCIGLLQSNETDVAMVNAAFPVVAPGLRQGGISGFDSFFFTGIYNKTSSFRENDIVDSFKVFSREALEVYMSFLGIILILLTITFVVLRDRTSSRIKNIQKGMTVTFGNSIHQFGSYEDIPDSRTINVLIVLLTVLTFFIYNFISSFMHTELVTVDSPKLIESFDELLSRPKVIPVMIELDGEKSFFESFPEERKEKKLSKTLLAMNPSDLLQYGNLSMFTNLGELMRKGLLVMVHKLFVEKSIFKAMCKFLPDNPGVREMNGGKGVGRYTKPISDEFLTTYLASDQVPDKVMKKLDRRVTRVRETAIVEGIYPVVNDFVGRIMEATTPEEYVQQCLDKKIVLEEPEVRTPGLKYYRNMLWLVVFGVFISFWILIFEVLLKKSISLLKLKVHHRNGKNQL